MVTVAISSVWPANPHPLIPPISVSESTGALRAALDDTFVAAADTKAPFIGVDLLPCHTHAKEEGYNYNAGRERRG